MTLVMLLLWNFRRAPRRIANVMSCRPRNKLHFRATLRVRVIRLWSAFQVEARASTTSAAAATVSLLLLLLLMLMRLLLLLT